MNYRNHREILLLSLLLALGTGVTASGQEKSGGKKIVPSREDTILLTVTATVEAIDHPKREVTLRGPLGNNVTFTVDEQVKRLNEVKVGDNVTADYYVSFAAELRKPTPEEERGPLVMVEGTAKAPPGTSPAGGALRVIKPVTPIEGLDRPTQTVTVKGPMGRYYTARVADPERLKLGRIGDTIVITYTEALAVRLEKAKEKAKD